MKCQSKNDIIIVNNLKRGKKNAYTKVHPIGEMLYYSELQYNGLFSYLKYISSYVFIHDINLNITVYIILQAQAAEAGGGRVPPKIFSEGDVPPP